MSKDPSIFHRILYFFLSLKIFILYNYILSRKSVSILYYICIFYFQIFGMFFKKLKLYFFFNFQKKNSGLISFFKLFSFKSIVISYRFFDFIFNFPYWFFIMFFINKIFNTIFLYINKIYTITISLIPNFLIFSINLIKRIIKDISY